ncbi:MAG: sulfotransferase family protein, partial [Ardenticatenaceae bacterium]
TLLRAMFDSHPEMAMPHESHFVVALARQRALYEQPGGFDVEPFITDLVGHRWFSRWGLAEDEVREALVGDQPGDCAEAIRRVFALYARRQGKPRYGDKTPGYVMHIPLLATLFPEARFVHLIRDGRDVALSLREMEWGPADLWESALYWRERVEIGRRAGRRLDAERYREVHYEDLVEEPEATLRELCSFLGLSFDSAMLHYPERAPQLIAPAEYPHRHRGVALPPTKGLRDWRSQMNREDLARFEAVAGGLLTRLGYERGLPRPPVTTLVEAKLRRLGRWALRATRGVAGRILERGPDETRLPSGGG